MRRRHEKRDNPQTLTDRLRGSATRLSGLALSAEQQAEQQSAAIALKERAHKEHDRHDTLLEKARNLQPSEWRRDENPPIPGLPEGVTVAYQLQRISGARHAILIRLGAEGTGENDVKELVHLVDGERETYSDEGALYERTRQIKFERGHSFSSGAVVPPERRRWVSVEAAPLTRVASSSEAFIYAERAVDVMSGADPAAVSSAEAQAA